MKTQVTKKLIITNTVFSATASVAIQVINFAILPLFIGNLGAEMYGIWIVSGIILGLTDIFDFGFDQGITRHIAIALQGNNRKELNKTIATGTFLFFIIGIMIGIILITFKKPIVVFFNLTGDNIASAESILLISGLVSLLAWPMRIPNAILTAAMRLKEKSLAEMAIRLGESTILLIMVYSSVDIVRMKIAVSLYGILTWIIPFWLVFRFVPEARLRLDHISLATLRKMSGFSLGVFLFGILGVLRNRLDALIITRVLGSGLVPLYDVARKLGSSVEAVSMLINSAILSSSYNLNLAEDKHRVQTLLEQGVLFRCAMSIPLACTAILYVPDFLSLWIGENYIHLSTWARLLLLIAIANSMGAITHILIGTGKIRTLNIYNASRDILNFTISILTISWLGIGGPILGTVISQTLLGIPLIFVFYCRQLQLSPTISYFIFFRVLFICLVLAGLWKFFDFKSSSWISLGVSASGVLLLQYIIVYCFVIRKYAAFDVSLYYIIKVFNTYLRLKKTC